MALTEAQRISISKDVILLSNKIEAASNSADQLTTVKDDLEQSDNNIKIFFDKFNEEQADNYFTEAQYLDGRTFTSLTETDIDNSARRLVGNIFFPTDGSWLNFQPEANAPSNGEPTAPAGTFAGNELDILSRNFDNFGIEPIIDFILNGQSSGVSDDTTVDPFSGGNGVTIEVTNGGQTVNNLVVIDNGSDSALCRITATLTAPFRITVDTIIDPSGTLGAGSTVRENIAGYSNADRNTLTPAFGANVLVGLKDELIQAVLDWESPVVNGSTAINANTRAEIIAPGGAKETTDNTKSIIDTWQAKSDTGADGKLVDGNIDSIEDEANFRRVTYISGRTTDIVTELGSVSSASNGTFSGSGVFFDRFNQINSRINLAGGPLSEFYEKDTAINGLTQIQTTAQNQLDTFNTELVVQLIVGGGQDSTTITVTDASDFSVSDSVYVFADGLTELEGTIQSITTIEPENVQIVLDFTVPSTYTSDLFARIYKQL